MTASAILWCYFLPDNHRLVCFLGEGPLVLCRVMLNSATLIPAGVLYHWLSQVVLTKQLRDMLWIHLFGDELLALVNLLTGRDRFGSCDGSCGVRWVDIMSAHSISLYVTWLMLIEFFFHLHCGPKSSNNCSAVQVATEGWYAWVIIEHGSVYLIPLPCRR